MKVCLIVNPLAGFGGFQKLVFKAAEHLARLGCEVKRVETTGSGDAIHLARQAADEAFDAAIAVGGDGTINEVCNGLVGTDTALGVLPAGTANVYAADVRIPIWWPLKPDAVFEAAEIIVSGQCRRVDLGRLQLADGSSRYFLMWCGIGLDAAITQAKQPAPTRSLSYASWIVAGTIITFDFMGTRAIIETDSATHKDRILMAVASNGQLYGRIWRMAPQAKMDDGLLDVAIMSGHGWPSTIKHAVGLTLKQHVKDPAFHLYRTTRLSVSAQEELPVHVDAETVGLTPVKIDIVPLALKVIVPQNAPRRLFEM
jgi:YegS/Rv2252/BmrU family lipid kinase